jgi:nicotinate dehydrogenase subunit A
MIDLTINGKAHRVDADPQTPLLYVLRNDLEMNGARFGCGQGLCGTCTVMIDGEARFSCVTPVSSVQGKPIKTVEGLGTLEAPGPLQRAFIEEQAVQCGYCIPGVMMRAQALLEKNPAASEAEIRTALSPSLCRCGTHARIVRAVRKAGAAMQRADAGRQTKGAAQ